MFLYSVVCTVNFDNVMNESISKNLQLQLTNFNKGKHFFLIKMFIEQFVTCFVT